MAGSRRRRQLQRQKERQLAAAAAAPTPPPAPPAPAPAAAPATGQFQLHNLPPDLLPEIQRRLVFLSRLAFASVCGAPGQQHLKLEAPWLILPAEHDDRARVLSLADGGASATVRTSPVAMRGHVAVGSSGGWLVTADDRGALRMSNPATGAHADLPAITTAPFIEAKSGGHWFSLDVTPFRKARFGDLHPPPSPDPGCEHDITSARSYTVTAGQMRQVFYRKVVLSASPTPDSYAAMLITERTVGAPAFATAAEPSWRMARSPDAVEDAIHHGGRFVSLTYTGRVHAWRRDAETGEFAGEEVAPRLAYEDAHLRRKYLAAAPDGRLMAVLKHARAEQDGNGYGYSSRDARTRVSFKVQVLNGDEGRWEEAADIGDTAIFVGVNGSLCVSAREHLPGVMPGCVYFTDDEVGKACLKKANCQERSYSYGQPDESELRDVGAYNLKAGRLETIRGLNQHQLWPPIAWFTPSFS